MYNVDIYLLLILCVMINFLQKKYRIKNFIYYFIFKIFTENALYKFLWFYKKYNIYYIIK